MLKCPQIKYTESIQTFIITRFIENEVYKRYENSTFESFDEYLPIDGCGHTPFGVSKSCRRHVLSGACDNLWFDHSNFPVWLLFYQLCKSHPMHMVLRLRFKGRGLRSLKIFLIPT